MTNTYELTNPDARSSFRTFFLIASVTDLVLGAAFFALYAPIYQFFAIPLPDSTQYLHLATAFVFVQGVGYWYVARNMERNVDMVKVGLIYKIAYISVVLYYLAMGQLPHLVFAFFAGLDVLFSFGFARFLMALRPSTVAAA